MSVGFRIIRWKNGTRALRGGISLRRGYLYTCEPGLDNSKNDLYVLGGAFKEAVWLNEGTGLISD